MKKENTNAGELPEGFTPGSWEFDPSTLAIKSSKGWHIAALNPYAPEKNNSEANAKLIASAPLLLEALKDLESEIGRHLYINNEESFKELLAARDKAKAIINRINQ